MKWSTVAALWLALAVSAFAADPPKSAECLACHDDKGASV